LKELRKISIIGIGLLGGSIGLTVSRAIGGIKTAGYSHRAATRRKARKLAVVTEVFDDIKKSVCDADLVILATPICTFEETFRAIADALPDGCIVTDVGSTKSLPHQWAAKRLPGKVHYAGSHPIAGSEQRGVEFARDDLFERSLCILTTTSKTDKETVQTLKKFWSALGCYVKIMTPAEHDKIFAGVSHLPHITAAALINVNDSETLKYAGKGFIDTSRIASGPANIWADVFATNADNTVKEIDKLADELRRLKKAIKSRDRKQIEKLLRKAADKRVEMINYKVRKKEIIS